MRPILAATIEAAMRVSDSAIVLSEIEYVALIFVCKVIHTTIN
tara:strand:+ start:130582 stop:130710 length:129 start_codon:yes stop_codon:yes gene_type:complete